MKRLLFLGAALASFFLCTSAQAAVITHSTNAGVIHETAGLAEFSTTGAAMAGLSVQVTFSDGSVSGGSWQAMGPSSGGISHVSLPFMIIQNGNTGAAGYNWSLYNLSTSLAITSVAFDGQPGSTVFDISGAFDDFIPGFIGTPGSAGGAYFDAESQFSFARLITSIDVTYSDAISLTGALPVGDLYRRMTLNFPAAGDADVRPFGPQQYIDFRQDTDSLAFGSVLTPVDTGSAVPDGSATLGLLGLSVAALAGFNRSTRAGKPAGLQSQS